MGSRLDFLAEVTQRIPEQREHLVRYYDWHSHQQRDIRAKFMGRTAIGVTSK